MPSYDVTGSFTGSCGLTIALVIPPGMMLTGSYTFFVDAPVSGDLSGSVSTDTEISGAYSGSLSGSLSGSVYGSSIVTASASTMGGAYTGSLLSTPFVGTCTVFIPDTYALMGTVQFSVTGSASGLVSGSLFTSPPSDLPLSGNVSSDLLSGSLTATITSDLISVKRTGTFEDATRMRRSYPFFRPRSKKVRYIIE